ncbi:MAG: hypothetical protein HZB26_16330, partial [Candidatus Hydrogenedentes bacterium]|nr:hypothetical protein [Candidatus Hydrogenedentota bacterium]
MNIATNGSLPQRIADTVRKLLTDFPSQMLRISFSVDGFGPQHDEIRKIPGLYEKCKESIALLREIQKEHPDLAINVMTVVSHYNQDGIEATIEKIERDLQPDCHFLMHAYGDTPEAFGSDFSVEEYVRIFKEAKQRKKPAKNHPLAPMTALLDKVQSKIIEETKAQGRQVVPCVAGSRLLVIDDDGEVKPCLELRDSDLQKDGLRGVNMVNIRDHGFSLRRAMRDPHARGVAKFVRDGKCHCTAECYMIPSILFSRRFFSRVAWATVKLLVAR